MIIHKKSTKKIQKDGEDMKKILITYLSPLPSRENYITYETDSNTAIKAFYTNEAGVRYLAAKPETQDIDTVIAVCTNAVMTKQYDYISGKSSYEYFSEIIKNTFTDADIITVENAEQGDVLGVFDAIKGIEQNSRIYLDITGGFRDAVYTLALISRFLEFKGMKVEKVVYSMQMGTHGRIKDYTSNFELMSLINGVSEFVNFGSCDTMYKYFYYSDNEAIHNLIESLKSFSDSITLGKISSLNENLKEFSERLKICEKSLRNIPEERIFAELLPIIKEKFFGENDSADYLSVIEWCINNNLLQQALTIYTEKIPEIIFKNEWIVYLDEAEINHPKYGTDNPYAALFYANFLDLDNSLLKQFKDIAIKAAKSGKPVSNKYLKRQVMSKAAKRYNLISKELQKYNRFANNGLGNARRQNAKAPSDWDNVTKDAWKILMDVDANVELGLVTNNAFYNTILENKDNGKPQTIDKKIAFLSEFKENVADSQEYKINIELEELKKISTAYVYFKAIRNEINHASDSENLSETQKKFFKSAGFEYIMSVGYLKRILMEQIEYIRSIQKE